MKAKKRRVRHRQMMMLDITVRAAKPEERREHLFDFEGKPVRIKDVHGAEWWVAPDVCRAIGIVKTGNAAARVPADEKMTVRTEGSHSGSRGGAQSLTLVNEAGLFRLIFMSRKPEAERFKTWVFSEVLPSIRRTGSYSLATPRVKAMARKLGSDLDTARVRCELVDVNKSTGRRLALRGAKPRDFQDYHNGKYLERFGLDAGGLRRALGQTSYRQTPLDRMDMPNLAALVYAEAVKGIVIEGMGRTPTVQEEAEILRQITAALTALEFSAIGAGRRMVVANDPARGPVLHVASPALG